MIKIGRDGFYEVWWNGRYETHYKLRSDAEKHLQRLQGK